MLRSDAELRPQCLADQARAARAVPEEHVLLRMRRAVDWRAVDKEPEGFYERSLGRPASPPAVLVRMLIVEQYADLSDREVYEQVGYNLLCRAFVGLGVDDPVPDDTTLVKFRARVGEQGLRAVFAELNRQWESAGLIGPERRVVDGVHLWAKVARRSFTALMAQGRALIVEAVAGVDAPRAEALRAEFGPASEEPERRGEEALRLERERTQKLLAAVAELSDPRVRERAALVQGLLGEADRPVSFNDADARWGYKAADQPFCGSKSHEALDPESRIITSLEVVPGNANEAVQTDELLVRETMTLKDGAVIIADWLYNNVTTVEQVEQAGARPCFSGLKAERVSDGFDYDAGADQLVCREGQRSIGKVGVDDGDLLLLDPRLPGLSAPGRVPEAGRAWRKEQLRVRGRIEPKFDEQMNRHGLLRARAGPAPPALVFVTEVAA